MSFNTTGFRWCLLFVLLGFTCLVFGQDNRAPDPNNYFLYPGLPGPQYSNDQTVYAKNINITYGEPQSAPFKWMTNLTYIKISMHQEGNPKFVQSIDLIGCSRASNNFIYWDGKLGPIDPKQANVGFLAAWNCTSSGSAVGTPLFFSHYFNFTAAADIQTSSVQSSATATGQTLSTAPGTQTGSSSAPSVSQTKTQPSPSASSSSSSSPSSNAAAIGGGVGGGIGGAILILGLAFLYLRHRKSQRKSPQQPQYQQYRPDHSIPSELPVSQNYSAKQKYTYVAPSELPSNQ